MVCAGPPARCSPGGPGRKRKAKAKASGARRSEGPRTRRPPMRPMRWARRTRRRAYVARKYLIETFGCQMNVHDSERMAGLLEQAGYESTADVSDADVVVINTCSVRERAEGQLYTRLGELRQMTAEIGHDPIVAVAGCVAQQEGAAILKRAPGVA